MVPGHIALLTLHGVGLPQMKLQPLHGHGPLQTLLLHQCLNQKVNYEMDIRILGFVFDCEECL